MKILNLYAGIGGNRKLWGNEHEITAVEYNQEVADVYTHNFPNDLMVVGDAKKYLLENYKHFDFIWASPPCQTHSKMVKATRHNAQGFIDLSLYQVIIFLDNFFKGGWVVENVKPYYTPLITNYKAIGRHLFWSNFVIGYYEVENWKGFITTDSLKGVEQLKKSIGITYGKNIYLNGNHSPGQVLRNCVNPELGRYILNCAMNKITKLNEKQIQLF